MISCKLSTTAHLKRADRCDSSSSSTSTVPAGKRRTEFTPVGCEAHRIIVQTNTNVSSDRWSMSLNYDWNISNSECGTAFARRKQVLRPLKTSLNDRQVMSALGYASRRFFSADYELNNENDDRRWPSLRPVHQPRRWVTVVTVWNFTSCNVFRNVPSPSTSENCVSWRFFVRLHFNLKVQTWTVRSVTLQ